MKPQEIKASSGHQWSAAVTTKDIIILLVNTNL